MENSFFATHIRPRLLAFWRNWVGALIVAISVTTTFRSAIADWYDIPTGSMAPTILIGDRIFVNKLAYDLKFPFTSWSIAQWNDPHRGDIVVFFSPADDKRLIKRVVGMPGDRVSMQNNQLFINGKPMHYAPLLGAVVDQFGPEHSDKYRFFSEDMDGAKHAVMITPAQPSLHTFGPIRVPDGHYFMLGDNRDNSGDSRFWGAVARWRIEGRATGVALSLDREHYYQPRWNRFLQGLD